MERRRTGSLSGIDYFLEKQPVGYVIAGIDAGLNKEKSVNCGWILDIGVLKPYRRQRIGSSLILRAMQYLKTQGMENEKVGFRFYHKSAIYELQFE